MDTDGETPGVQGSTEQNVTPDAAAGSVGDVTMEKSTISDADHQYKLDGLLKVYNREFKKFNDLVRRAFVSVSSPASRAFTDTEPAYLKTWSLCLMTTHDIKTTLFPCQLIGLHQEQQFMIAECMPYEYAGMFCATASTLPFLHCRLQQQQQHVQETCDPSLCPSSMKI